MVTVYKDNHVLIGGCTGSGKSVLLNNLMLEMLEMSPDKINFYLIDPKRVELGSYKNLPHTIKYVQTADEVVRVLDDAIRTMESRYDMMERNNLKKYNGKYIYIIMDEMADILDSNRGKEIKERMKKILRLGRASRIFIISATQSPSRKTVPAELQQNYTCKVALRNKSAIESRQIIGVNGAEKLPRYGKALVELDGYVYELDVPMYQESDVRYKAEYWQRTCKPVVKQTPVKKTWWEKMLGL